MSVESGVLPALVMDPPTGERLVGYVGDRLRFRLRRADGLPVPEGWRGLLRTNLGRAGRQRREIVASRGGERIVPVGSWRDVPMREVDGGWTIELTLTEVGYFKAKAYAVDPRGWQVWPEGADFGVAVHPDRYRTGNTIYCVFPRLMGETKSRPSTADARLEARLRRLEGQGYAVLPPSGKLRDVTAAVPHMVRDLGCRMVHLLPINLTPTTFGRFGRFGSPYAGLDLTAIDPALIEFDRRTTGVEQFRELADTVHAHGARLVLDLVINHTGWSSSLQEAHPEWFLRNPDGTFHSPGAWGITWEDLVELDESPRPLWDEFAEAFLTWCRRGVDGFRCDAGYQVPMPVWRYAIARVRDEFPDALFLLEGLGGAWVDTELLLTEGGMQWAYSELFQEFSGLQISGYLDHALKQCRRVGTLVHYSETHDNERLARKGKDWSRLRNRLCALTSANGGFGFTCGVEWLAAEKIKVHGCTGLAWGSADNLVDELSRLNRLLADHPCFFDGARLTRVSPAGADVFALRREAAATAECVLVLLNTDLDKPHSLTLEPEALAGFLTPDRSALAGGMTDLLGSVLPKIRRVHSGAWEVTLAAGASHCLAPAGAPADGSGELYRRERAQAAWAVQALAQGLDPEAIGPFDWRALARLAAGNPTGFLASLSHLDPARARTDLIAAIESAMSVPRYPNVVVWTPEDVRRVTLVPDDHWLLLESPDPFRATLRVGTELVRHLESIPGRTGFMAAFPPVGVAGAGELEIEIWRKPVGRATASVRLLRPECDPEGIQGHAQVGSKEPSLVLLTNGRGGMARLCVDLGQVTSKYDCLLGANLHPALPVDRHVMAKRVRAWAMANGFLSPLNHETLAGFEPGPSPRWEFQVPTGDGRRIAIRMTAAMVEGENTTVLRFARGTPQPEAEPVDVWLTVRVDLEDRNFHWETKRNPAAEAHFESQVRVLSEAAGFVFASAPERGLWVTSSAGAFHRAPEWSEGIPHPVEATRGMTGAGDAYSPGWFELPLPAGNDVVLTATCEGSPRADTMVSGSMEPKGPTAAEGPSADRFGEELRQALRAFVVKRGNGKTVIAGYPWFLDWGRDTLICARGLLAAGMLHEVEQILLTFGRFEFEGTLPNTIHGEDASNRETSDAPLWYGLVCEEWAMASGGSAGLRARGGEGDAATFLGRQIDRDGRTLAEVLRSIAVHHLRGTPVGVAMDEKSALLWSPAHFTWMDTNHPACTPREGYPIEIQAFWIRLLRQLDRLRMSPENEPWSELARRAEESLQEYFWIEDCGWWADVLRAGRGVPASAATVDDALRSNGLLAVSLGVVSGERARRSVEAARRHLVIPGGVRSLAPLPVRCPLEIRGGGGVLLNNPREPYWGRYEGDEDTRRKPAYHNGTAWTWKLPVFAEALVRAWEGAPESVAAAKGYLLSLEPLLASGCLGQLPEILDGDAPHQPRGCDAQAWSVTEALRVWRMVHDGWKG
ncbi:MAG: glycogen debranching enzyme N-terminal domain-containing protein [Verrucomicrobia bacterium]|nr:glycogen debranching enzyme N-terminal domain-containing protein [Verrucomicrobiota bacterium]